MSGGLAFGIGLANSIGSSSGSAPITYEAASVPTAHYTSTNTQAEVHTEYAEAVTDTGHDESANTQADVDFIPGPLTYASGKVGAWYRLDIGALNGSGNPCADGEDIKTLNDRSGNGNHLGTPEASSPELWPAFIDDELNGHPVARFVAADTHRLSDSASTVDRTNDHSIFAVVKYATLPAGFHGVGHLGGSTVGFSGSAAWYGGPGLASPQAASSLSTGTWYRQGKTADPGVATQGYLNGATNGSSAANAYSSGTNIVLGDYGSQVGWFDGDLAEWIIYTDDLDSTELAAQDAYFTRRYDL